MRIFFWAFGIFSSGLPFFGSFLFFLKLLCFSGLPFSIYAYLFVRLFAFFPRGFLFLMCFKAFLALGAPFFYICALFFDFLHFFLGATFFFVYFLIF